MPPNSPAWASPDLEHDADVRPGDRDEARDLARAAGAHLDHEVAGVVIDAQHRDRGADLVVERVARGDRLRLGAKDGAQQVLGGGLAVRPGDPDTRSRPAGAHPGDDLAGEGRRAPRARRRRPAGPRRRRARSRDDHEHRARLDRRGGEQRDRRSPRRAGRRRSSRARRAGSRSRPPPSTIVSAPTPAGSTSSPPSRRASSSSRNGIMRPPPSARGAVSSRCSASCGSVGVPRHQVSGMLGAGSVDGGIRNVLMTCFAERVEGRRCGSGRLNRSREREGHIDRVLGVVGRAASPPPTRCGPSRSGRCLATSAVPDLAAMR